MWHFTFLNLSMQWKKRDKEWASTDAWSMVHGAWCGAWCVVHGDWSLWRSKDSFPELAHAFYLVETGSAVISHCCAACILQAPSLGASFQLILLSRRNAGMTGVHHHIHPFTWSIRIPEHVLFYLQPWPQTLDKYKFCPYFQFLLFSSLHFSRAMVMPKDFHILSCYKYRSVIFSLKYICEHIKI